MRKWLPRVTVATIVEKNKRFLMVEEMIRGEKIINQPAGHLEPNETLIDAAIRETLEETGWHIKIDYLVECSQWTSNNSKNHYIRFCFAATAISHEPQRSLDEGIISACWMSREEIAKSDKQLRSPLVLHHIDHYINGKNNDLEFFSYYD